MIYYFVFKLYSSHSLTPYYHQAPNHHQFSMLIHYFLITFYVIFRNSWQTIIHGPLTCLKRQKNPKNTFQTCQKTMKNSFLKFSMTLFKSSESPLQNMLKIFVDDQKLKKLCVSTFESAHVFLLAFCHIEPSALRIRFF